MKFIYQEFYSASSASDQGTLYQLRNLLHRVDVTGPDGVTGAFRQHFAFVEDCLDAFILAAAMDIMGMNELDDQPKEFRPPPLIQTASCDEQYSWLSSLAQEILERHVKLDKDKNPQQIAAEAMELDQNSALIQEMYDPLTRKYTCTCAKEYKSLGFFKRHLVKEHNWTFDVPEKNPSETDLIASYRGSFMKNALLLRDTYNAFRMGDGNRISRNTKFEMLCASVRGHTKYKLWLWRFQAYITAILTPKQAEEYLWNCTASTSGGVGNNIPNDNLVELHVQLVKKLIKEQGGNFTYQSAKKAALSAHLQKEMKENLEGNVAAASSGRSRTKTDSSSDLYLILKELVAAGVFRYEVGRKYDSFSNFKDVYQRINLPELHAWITKQKTRASSEMF
ncbi:uncharacterized protein LOC134235829 [Saccostrea cucullata]|uniref:uncharacterized protein LOC134235829 n=1 Tax=Saccostrea cuccullata TaxID=36930 RepID=UPI002ED4EC14